MGRVRGCCCFFSSCPYQAPGLPAEDRSSRAMSPSLAPFPPQSHSHCSRCPMGDGRTCLPAGCSMQREGGGVGDSCLKRENASFPAPPAPRFCSPVLLSVCTAPLPGSGAILHPLRVRAGPLPVGWALLAGVCPGGDPASWRWKVPPQGWSSAWDRRKVTAFG